MDVKTTLLNGEIEEEVYVEKPDGFVVHHPESPQDVYSISALT